VSEVKMASVAPENNERLVVEIGDKLKFITLGYSKSVPYMMWNGVVINKNYDSIFIDVEFGEKHEIIECNYLGFALSGGMFGWIWKQD